MVYVGETKSKFRIEIFGRDSARITFTLMFPYIKKQVHKMAREHFEDGHSGSKSKSLTLVANSLAMRIKKMIPDIPKAQSTNTSNALVPVNEINALMYQIYSDLEEVKGSTIKTSDSAQEYADKINLDDQVHSNNKSKEKLT